MILDFTNSEERKKGQTYFDYLMENRKKVEVKVVRKKRSLKQNGYYRLLVKWFSSETGYDIQTVTDEFVKAKSPDIFVRKVTGNLGDYNRYRSTSELNTLEMTTAINRFRDFSSQEAGIYLPEPNEQKYIEHIQNELEKFENSQYVR